MKLRILRDVHNHKKGEVKDIKEAEAKALLTQGYAVRVVSKFAKNRRLRLRLRPTRVKSRA